MSASQECLARYLTLNNGGLQIALLALLAWFARHFFVARLRSLPVNHLDTTAFFEIIPLFSMSYILYDRVHKNSCLSCFPGGSQRME